MLALLGVLGVLGLIALHAGAALSFGPSLFERGSSALAASALVLLIVVSVAVVAHAFGAKLIGRWLGAREE